MKLACERCDQEFEAATFRGYCEPCLEHFAGNRKRIHAAQRPGPGICADGQFVAPKECPSSVYDPVRQQNVCGLCGSSNLDAGYGLGSGYGMGGYNFCLECEHFLDFCEDKG